MAKRLLYCAGCGASQVVAGPIPEQCPECHGHVFNRKRLVEYRPFERQSKQDKRFLKSLRIGERDTQQQLPTE